MFIIQVRIQFSTFVCISDFILLYVRRIGVTEGNFCKGIEIEKTEAL